MKTSIKKILLSIGMMLVAGVSFAQDATAPATTSFWDDPFKDPLLPFYLVIAFVFFVTLLVVVVAIQMIRVLNVFIRKAAEERAAQLGIPYAPEPSLWRRFWDKINGYRPMEKEAEIMLDHNYDGITELDNHLPPWWKWLFYGTIAWSVVYMVVYHISNTLPLMDQEYQNEVTLAQEQKAKYLASQPALTIDENALKFENDAAIIQAGKKVFATNCTSCHNAEGQGSIGPNLTDEYWLHGGGVREIYTTIKNGVPEKGMISWATTLSPQQMRDVTFYIMSIKGTNPPNPKAPQGTIWKDETTPAATDTLKVQASL
jgi:cytochrome c oxidase cbb3-type subunit 3